MGFSKPRSISDRELLLGLDKPTLTGATKAVTGLGKVTGRDQASGMYLVALAASVNADTAIHTLEKRPGVRFVLPASARFVQKESLSSVKEHVLYLQDADKMKPKGDDEGHDGADFFGALQYYLERHVAAGGDTVERGAIGRGFAQAKRMPLGKIANGDLAPTITGNPWTFIGPTNLAAGQQLYEGMPPLAGRVSCIAYDPTNAQVIYAGSGGGGLWKTSDGGVTWACISDKSPWIYGAVDSIAIDPSNHLTLYVGTGDFDGFYDDYNQGIMKSTDGGVTWTNLAATVPGIFDEAVSHILIDPDNDKIILCTTGRGYDGGNSSFDSNVFRSIDGGATWKSAGLPIADYCTIDVSLPNVSKVRTFYVGAPGGATYYQFYKSIDEGATWTAGYLPTSQIQFSIACSKVDASTIYLLSGNNKSVYKSTDGATTWTSITNNILGTNSNDNNWSQAQYDYYIATYKAPEATGGEVVFVGLLTAEYSTDGGATWVDYALSIDDNTLLHTDQHEFATSASDPTQVLLGNDGGLFRLKFAWTGSTPTITATSLNKNLATTQLYAIAPHPTNPAYILSGAQDNSSPSSLGDLSNWVNLFAGDGGMCGWSLPTNQCFVSAEYGYVALYNLTGGDKRILGNGFDYTEFIAPMTLSPDGKTLYVGAYDTVYASDLTSSAPYFAEGTFPHYSYLTALAVAPSDGDEMYGSTEGGLYYTTTGYKGTWTEVVGTPESGLVNSISPSPANANDVLMGYANFNLPHLWRIADVTAKTPVWVNVSGTGTTALPDVPINTILRDPTTPATTWYVGTDVGVFMTTNAGTTWSNVSGALPHVQIMDMKLGNGYIYAGTFGRGIWRISLSKGPTVSTLGLNLTKVTADTPVTGTVTLTAAAPAAGVTVTLKSSSAAATLPASLPFTSGTITKTFPITTNSVSVATAVTITATADGAFKTTTLTVEPADPVLSVVLSRSSETALIPLSGTVNLTAAATGTTIVKLSSSTTDATVPATLTYSLGARSAGFTITTLQVTTSTLATISATGGGVTKTASFTILPGDPVSAFALSSENVTGGAVITARVTLAHAAPTAGIVVTITSNSPAAMVPGTLAITSGLATKEFTFNTYSVATVVNATISVNADGVTKSLGLTINPASFSLVITPPSVVGGINSDGVVRLAAKSTANTVMSIASSSTVVTVQAAAKILAGATVTSFPIITKPVSANTLVTIKVLIGTVTQPATLMVTLPAISSLTLIPTTEVGGGNPNATIKLAGPAGPTGDVVSISSSSADVTVPATVTVLAGATSVNFPMKTKAVSVATPVVITVTLGNSKISETLTLVK